MEYTSIHIYDHFLSDDILHSIETDNTLKGNSEQDFGLDAPVQHTIDYVWSSFRNDWKFFNERSAAGDPYGTRRSRELMERLFSCLGYELTRQTSSTLVNGSSFEISHICQDLKNLPIIVIGDKTGDADIDTLDKCSLDYRAKGAMRKKSPHATMLEYLNNTENVYGIVANGRVLRILRNTGQLVKLTYIEFDLQRMLEEDKYTEFCLMFRLLHATRFRVSGDEQCIMERYFNMSIESGNRIRNGLSMAVQRTMETIGRAAVRGNGEGNEALRNALLDGRFSAVELNKELIHFIYRLLFLFIIEERGLVYQIPAPEHEDYKRLCKLQEIYKQYYAATRLRKKSELMYLRQRHYFDLWQGLMDTFRLFENEKFGEPLGIKPLGGVLFDSDTLHYLKDCRISNDSLLTAFAALNEFTDEKGQRVKINYSSLDVEEFGSVYEGILEKRPFITKGMEAPNWDFGFVGGLDRQSTSSYYTRPDLVQSLIKTTLIPVVEEKIASCATKEEKVKTLLNMKVCDAASGSGHIVLAMARTIAWYVCTIRTGEDNPASLDYREALRDVIQKCVYAVDYNPDAVELCKVVLWIEGYCAGKPLSFLDHHIRCGNSVVGVTDLDMLLDGVPNEAFSADSKESLKAIKNLNAEALKDVKMLKDAQIAGVQMSLFDNENVMYGISEEQIGLAELVKEISLMPEDNLEESRQKQNRWESLMISPRVKCLRRACDIYTYAFYKQFKLTDLTFSVEGISKISRSIPYTRTVYQALEEIKQTTNPTIDYKPIEASFKHEVSRMSKKFGFFHWCIEFPDVFAYDGGFDVMCGNPPWDKIKIEDEEWFAKHGRTDIANASPASKRKKMIDNLQTEDSELFKSYCEDLIENGFYSNFVRFCGRFNCAEIRDVDLYLLFAELCAEFSKDSWGMVIPTGIATNDSNKDFFAKLVKENRLVSLFDFENREGLFDIHRMFKFCLLTAANKSLLPRDVSCGFYLTRIDHLSDPNRIYRIKTTEIAKLNPNTTTCPTFRTERDARITKKIYQNSQILQNEITEENPWEYRTSSMYHMTNDSGYFRTYKQLIENGYEFKDGVFFKGKQFFVPLYEGKMIYLYNHHFGTWPISDRRPNAIPSPTENEYKDPQSSIVSWYWVDKDVVEGKLIKKNSKGKVLWKWNHNWFFGFRVITRSVDSRTFISSIMPRKSCSGNSITLMYSERSTYDIAILQGMLSSLTFDFVVRQKLGGINMSTFFVKQFPVLKKEQISSTMSWEIVKRVIKLCYFNHDLDEWAEELYQELSSEQQIVIPQLREKEPFIYNPDQRAVWQAELDAIFAHLYGLTTEELRYILDPEDVCGEGCINETFRVLKDNEIRQYGEYRTKRLVMKAWYNFGYDK
ncbi:MAG: restriction endonuclease [Bacteroidaceae bacterium]|nr:restriction endonuclease [Bacteroidaceae bacterium]